MYSSTYTYVYISFYTTIRVTRVPSTTIPEYMQFQPKALLWNF